MPRLRVHNFSISLDGYVAGPDQGPDHPLGVGGERLHEWVFATRFGRRMIGREGGSTGIDDEHLAAGEANIGATIMGRNMFGPVRGEWPDDSWTGWWGPNPPYHHPVFVLTHHPRPALEMDGGTTFHFVDDTSENVLEQAFSAAGGKDVRLGGGAATVRRFLRAGIVDDLHLALVPTLLGTGERLYDDLGDLPGYTVSPARPGDNVTHIHLTKVAD
ncbi:deaminase [Nocardia sp. MDA0666]|uniref:dihydrofolate reductase family protein n=1 Tax=Nocardia sp. MDA0666 TaxID=2135448 RepID=UPI000D116B10|nr:dihydrofolate reductase family protein [Nocardia sp. MDA0666]PSR67670.1 deaminase [Nocardia sp. MDA0666]